MDTRRKSILVLTIFIAIALALLLPGLSIAGSLEPVDPPGPTMHTLDEIYNKPVWKMFNKVFVDWPDNLRFAVCDNGTPDDTGDDMVLDKDTGLVWERSPRTYTGDWWHAQWECWAHHTGGRRGWRIPTVSELDSLYDYCAETDRALPCGHPFINADCWYWSATSWFFDSNKAIGFWPYGTYVVANKSDPLCYWCVRGGFGVIDAQ